MYNKDKQLDDAMVDPFLHSRQKKDQRRLNKCQPGTHSVGFSLNGHQLNIGISSDKGSLPFGHEEIVNSSLCLEYKTKKLETCDTHFYVMENNYLQLNKIVGRIVKNAKQT